MKKMIMNVFLGCALFAIIALGFFVFFTENKKHELCRRIVIFTPTVHAALEEIEEGFKKTLSQGSSVPCIFKIFNANGNKTLLRAQAEELVAGDYDLIFTIGTGCTQTVVELLKRKEKETPHVFSAVDGPEFARSLTEINKTSTGVYVKSDYENEMQAFCHIKPTMKNMLLVYDPMHGTGLEKDKQAIEKILAGKGITLHSIEVFQTNEIQQKVSVLLPSMDAVLVLTDNTIVAGIDVLITLCNRCGVTLCASDLESGKKGAALAYGITEYESGTNAGDYAVALLEKKIRPCELPVRAVEGFRLEVNQITCKKQNVSCDDVVQKGVING